MSENSYSTLSLINDAFTDIAETGLVQFKDRKHFFNFFGMVMRRKVIDKARALKAEKSGGKVETVDIAEGMTLAISPTDTEEMLDLDRAVAQLEREEPELAQIVYLRYFAGLTIAEIAEQLSMGQTTVKTKWQLARAFLLNRIRENQEKE